NKQWKLTTPPVYGSIDLRNAGFKLAPIDMNLFPAGFNNLNPDFLSQSVAAAQTIIKTISPTAKKILVIPKNNNSNLYYLSNVKTLGKILESAGFEIRFGLLNGETKAAQDIVLESGEKIVIEPLARKDDKLFLDHFEPDIILLNNDLSEGIPE